MPVCEAKCGLSAVMMRMSAVTAGCFRQGWRDVGAVCVLVFEGFACRMP